MKRIFFIMGVLLLGLGFLLSSCGYGPQTKTVAEKGAYAVFFPKINTEYISVGVPGEPLNDSDFTVEAWIKTDATGAIFGRGSTSGDFNSDGFVLSIEVNNNVRFSIKSLNFGTFFVEGSDNDGDISDGEWHHVAGVLVDKGHDYHPVTATCTVGAMISTHIDIYVDGVFRDCSDADILTMLDDDRIPDAIGADIGGLLNTAIFEGTIDEVRLWREARTPEQIETWMYTEITVENWHQANPYGTLVGYWRFNEGTGSTAIDSSGYGHHGAKLLDTGETDPETGLPIFSPWDGGWVAGYPF